MFVNNLIIKIEDKNKLLITQLVNTKNHMSCDYGMLALYTRRMGPAALMNIDDYQRELADVTSRYPQIDYIFLKDYHAQIVVYPRLRT